MANCDGGISTYFGHAYNAGIWWPTLAGAVGPGSLTESIYERVANMRPHDFLDAVNRLEREIPPEDRFLNDDWNLVDGDPATIGRTISWLCDLTGWPDPVRGGAAGLGDWIELPVGDAGGIVYVQGTRAKSTWRDEAAAIESIGDAEHALNANFRHGGSDDSRFNWVRGW